MLTVLISLLKIVFLVMGAVVSWLEHTLDKGSKVRVFLGPPKQDHGGLAQLEALLHSGGQRFDPAILHKTLIIKNCK